jgi:hypothetical protein
MVQARLNDACSARIEDYAKIVAGPIEYRCVSMARDGLGTAMAQRGRSSPYLPDVQAQGKSSEGVDTAVRAATEEAVIQLARRFGQ